MAITTQYKVIEEVEIDFIYKNPSPIIMCPQFEGGERAIKVKLKNAGVEFPVPSGYTPHVFMLKFDKKVVDNICEYDGSTVTVKITKQMSFVEGRNLMRIALVSDTTGEYAQTCEIYLRVTESADVDGAEQSTDEFEALVMYANQAKDSASKASQSETNAKASETAAIAARKGAEDAEGRVQAIVSGNEAYTKQQSHDLFAAALVTKTGPAASLEVYPDKLSNLKVYANGFTRQAGAGDPSPSNVRALTNGGQLLAQVSLSGAKTGGAVSVGNGYYRFGITLSQVGVTATNYKGLCSHWKMSVSKSDQSEHFYIEGNVMYIVSAKASTTADMDAYIAENNVVLWYAPSDGTGSLYTPIILQGGEYRATCLELTAPLCEGDSVVSLVKSGCDKVVVFDGSEDENWTQAYAQGGRYVYSINVGQYVSVAYANWLPFTKTLSSGSVDSYFGLYTISPQTNLNVNIPVGTISAPSVTEWKTYLAAHPLTVWYRSTNYTPTADIPVSLETHQQAVLVLDGTENWIWDKSANGIYRGILKNVSPQGKNGFPMCSHAKSQTTFTNTNGVTAEGGTFTLAFPDIQTESGLADFKAYIAAQYDAGTPVTIVYQLATPITYAHPAVVLPALPDDTGKVTITGQSGGTVTVVFNKSIIKEIAEIKAAMLAMGANLSM